MVISVLKLVVLSPISCQFKHYGNQNHRFSVVLLKIQVVTSASFKVNNDNNNNNFCIGTCYRYDCSVRFKTSPSQLQTQTFPSAVRRDHNRSKRLFNIHNRSVANRCLLPFHSCSNKKRVLSTEPNISSLFWWQTVVSIIWWKKGHGSPLTRAITKRHWEIFYILFFHYCNTEAADHITLQHMSSELFTFQL